MNTEEEKYAKTEPFADTNDVDSLGKQAGLEMTDKEELALQDKLEKRDEDRLDGSSEEETI
jgi:hypothetical protein